MWTGKVSPAPLPTPLVKSLGGTMEIDILMRFSIRGSRDETSPPLMSP